MNIILFDSNVCERLFPITYTRPVGEIRIGAFTIREKWLSVCNTQVSILTRPYLSKKFPAIFDSENTYINGSVFPIPPLLEAIEKLKHDEVIISGNQIIAFKAGKINYDQIDTICDKYHKIEFPIEIPRLTRTWETIYYLNHAITLDLKYLFNKTKNDLLPEHVRVVSPENIRTGNNVVLENCILNASQGAIYIDDDAVIMDGAIIRGPVYIGKKSIVKMGAKIYGPFACGEQCRIGGEITDSVIQSFSNKGHDGFLGHSYLGEWCNLGADTNISNLKNNYDKIKLWDHVSQRFEQTGMQFLGLIMGDHSKTAINTMINSGTVMGVSCNIYGSDFPKNYIPSFTHGRIKKLEELPLSQSFKTAESVMKRRNKAFDETEKEILTFVFEQTKSSRKYI